MFKGYLANSKYINIHYAADPDAGIKIIQKYQPQIILLGGDVDGDEFNAIKLLNMMNELALTKKRLIYISTWNTDEARLLKGMLPKSLYCPFSESLANIVKERAMIMRGNKLRKK